MIKLFFIFYIYFFSSVLNANEITPYKWTDIERKNGSLKYEIPLSSRFLIKKGREDSSDIIYYFSKPTAKSFPIAILVGGSSLEDSVESIIHFHRYFLKEFLDLGIGVITIEQQGVDGDKINKKEFINNYTRSNRLSDHRSVIEYIRKYPPKGWNGRLIFLGASEGGPIVTTLTTDYVNITIATINFSGAGDFSWRDELWYFMQDIILKTPWHIKLRIQLPSWMPYSLSDLYYPKSRKDHDNAMDETIKNPTANLKLAGMTYKYHKDILVDYPKIEYEKIKTPYLVVIGEKDSILESAEAFVNKAETAGAPLTYMRITDMDHYIRKREDIIKDSFAWLKDRMIYKDKDNQQKNQFIHVVSNDNKGFYSDYFYSISNLATKDKPIYIAIISNNTPGTIIPEDDGDYTTLWNEYAKIWWLNSDMSKLLRNKLPIITLTPAFPTQDNSGTYSNSLNRKSMQDSRKEWNRQDLQLIEMIKDLKDRLQKEGYKIHNKVLFYGFSSQADFANRFSLLHPQLVEAVAVGGIVDYITLPVAKYEGKKLTYPLGVADLNDIKNHEFNLEEFKKIKFFWYDGDDDINTTFDKRHKVWSEYDIDTIFELFANRKYDKNKLYDKKILQNCLKILKENKINFTYKRYKKTKHAITQEMKDDVVSFFSKIITLKEVKNILEENHPGFYDDLNKNFTIIAEHCYNNAIAKDLDLENYIKCFNDNHLYLRNNISHEDNKQWIESLEWKSEIFDDTLYIKIPTFMTSKIVDQKIENYLNIIKNNVYKDIIFDIRGNGGGNDMYFQVLFKQIFGEEYYINIMEKYFLKTYVDVRTSNGNVEYWSNFYKDNNIKDDNYLTKLHECLKNNFIMCKFNNDKSISIKQINSNFHNKIYIIIDDANYSASLDFIDELKLLASNNVILIGKSTGKDSLYMNVREIKLSNNKILGIPTQVWRNRLRDDKAYDPDIAMEFKKNIDSNEIQKILKSTTNIAQHNLIIYPGRFQPFHEGHYNMIREAQKLGKHVLIAISQARGMINDKRNVFSGDDREKMIRDTLEKDGFKNYSIVQLDYINKDKTLKDWDSNLIKAAKAEYRKVFKIEPKKEDIAFIYYDRDKANYDKRFNKDFAIIEVKSSFDDDISATKVRHEFFEEGRIDEKLPSGTKKFLESFNLSSKIQIALTVDDLPFHGKVGNNKEKLEKVKKFISILKKYNIPGVYGFVNGGKVNTKEDKEILKLWTDNYPIGNHTFSHPSLNDISQEKYVNDILENEKILKQFSNKNQNWKVFRYTFLQEGDTLEKRNYIRNFLLNNNYKTAQVTIDFEDWAFNSAFTTCSIDKRKNKKEIEELKKNYLINAERSLIRAKKLSDTLFKKPIKHILLLHLGEIEIEMLEDLIKLYLKNNVEFIPLSEAMQDEIYQINYNTPYKDGREFIYQIAISNKIDLKSLFQDEKFHFDEKELKYIYNLCKEG